MAKKTTKQASAVQADVVPADAPVSKELAATTADGTGVMQFLGALTPFFSKAAVLEQGAMAIEAASRTWATPATQEEDAALMEQVRHVRDRLKEAETHWNPVTSLFSNIHKRFTTARGRTTKALDLAIERGNAKHTAYKEAAEREARKRADEQRRADEERARQERQAELDRLEQVALDAEAASSELSEREQLYVAEVVKGRQPLDAAARAGFKTPASAATRLAGVAKVQEAIAAGKAAVVAQQQAQAVAQRPLEVTHTRVEGPAVNAGDRTTYSAIITDEAALIAAIIAGTHGIPVSLLTVKPAALNQQARDLKELIKEWPGVQLKKSTGIV